MSSCIFYFPNSISHRLQCSYFFKLNENTYYLYSFESICYSTYFFGVNLITAFIMNKTFNSKYFSAGNFSKTSKKLSAKPLIHLKFRAKQNCELMAIKQFFFTCFKRIKKHLAIYSTSS